MGNDPTVSLLICDDHKVLTDALSMVVGLDPSLSLVAAPVHSPEEGVALAQEQLPDVVLMDIVFKGSAMTGIEATRRIKEGSPSTKVVIMTAHDDDRLMVEAVEAGASGFLSKDLPADEILNATKAAAEGEVLIDPVTLTRLLAQVAREREEQRDAMALLGDLTDRERQILQLLAQGKRNDDIAAELYISPQTVQTHVRSILGKLRVHSKLEAVAFAVKHGAFQVTERYPHSGIQPHGPGVEACVRRQGQTSGPANPRWDPETEGPSEPLPRSGLHHCQGRSARRTLPFAVLGRVVTDRTSRGALNRASASRQCSRS
jgi:NarL family two-component system response regulator LiaR